MNVIQYKKKKKDRIIINGITFKGQYQGLVNSMLNGYNVRMYNFKTNGKCKPTKQIGRFKELLNQSKVDYVDLGNGSLSNCNLKLIKDE